MTRDLARTLFLAMLAAATGLVAAFATGCSDARSTPTERRAQPVWVSTVQHAAHGDERRFTATVRARVESEIGFRAGGKVLQRLVEVGDAVKPGQAIARLDAADYDLGLQAARDQRRAAQVDAEQAASDEARFRRLLADGSVGAADHERQKARADAAAARLDQAQRGLELASNRQRYATLVAPYAAVVTALRLEVGQVVAEGQPVVSLARQGERELVVDLPEAVAQQLQAGGTTATVLPDPVTGRADATRVALRLRELAPMASSTARTFRARFAPLDRSPGATAALRTWPLGSTAQLRLAGPGQQGVWLPASALIKAEGSAGVWVVQPPGSQATTASFQAVDVLAFEADRVRVAGLKDGQRVVSVGAQKLDATMPVVAVERTGDAFAAPNREARP
jgi:RND family efflux transporter MFP subunit